EVEFSNAGRTSSPGELEEERRADAGLGVDADLPVHPPDELAADVEAQSGAAGDVRLVRVVPVELLEDRVLLRERDAEPLVADLNANSNGSLLRRHDHLAASRRVL